MNKWTAFNILSSAIAIFFLLASLLLFFYLRKTDKYYTEILSNQLESFEKLRSITQISNNNFLMIYRAHLNTDVDDSIHVSWSKSVTKNSENFTRLYHSLDVIRSDDSIYRNLIQSRKAYLNAGNHFFMFNHDVNKQMKTDFFVYTVQPSFNHYQNSLEVFTEYYKAEIEKHSSTLTSDMNKNSLHFLFLGFSPLILILTYGFSSVLMVLGFICFFSFKSNSLTTDIIQ